MVAWLLALTALVSCQLPWVVCAGEEVHLHFSDEHDHSHEGEGINRHHEGNGAHHQRLVWTVIRTGIAGSATHTVVSLSALPLGCEGAPAPEAARLQAVDGTTAPPAALRCDSTVLLL